MKDLEGVAARVETLETHVLGQDREKPGVLMRLDRLELLMKLGVTLAGMGLAWKILDVFGSLIAMRSVVP